MLKARVDAGEDLERGVELVARNIGRVFESGARRGYMRIQAYPSLDPLLAAVVLHRAARGLGIHAILSVSTSPQPTRGPVVALGFSSPSLRSWDVDDHLLVVASGQVKGSPPPGAVYLEVDGSVSSLIGLGLLEHKMHARDLLPLLAASYASRYVDQAGRFHGVDRALLEALADQAGLDMYTGVKAYNPHRWPAWKSISSTCNPYLPTLTGRPDSAREILSSLGINPERRLADLEQGDLEKLASSILEQLGRYGGVEAVRVLGGVIVSGDPVIGDLRMASDVFAHTAETGGAGALAGLILDLDLEYPVAEVLLESLCTSLPAGVEEYTPVKVKVAPWLRTYKLPQKLARSPLLAWRALELTSKVEREALVLVEEGGSLRASALQAEAAAPGVARKLVDNRLARLEGLWLVFEHGEE